MYTDTWTGPIRLVTLKKKQPIKMIQLKYWNAFRWKRWGQEREGRGETYDYPR